MAFITTAEGNRCAASTCADKATALEAAPGCSFAFVDVNLRDGATGPAIARRIAHDHGLKVVFVTANPGQIEPMQKICREWAGSNAPAVTQPAVVTTNCRAAAFAKSQLAITPKD